MALLLDRSGETYENKSIPPGIYDPRSAIRKYKHDDDIDVIRLSFYRSGCVYEDKGYKYNLPNDKEWKRPSQICNRPLFIDGTPSRFDALQGDLADTWFVAGINALTLKPELIRHVVPTDQSFDNNYTGAFHFRIWQLGFWYDVVVDDRLPVFKHNQKLCYAHSQKGNVFWAALLEKAYSKVYAFKANFSYGNLVGGCDMAALQDLSGGIVETLSFWHLPAGTSVKSLMYEVALRRAMIICRCHEETAGLFKNHPYIVVQVFKCSDQDPDYGGFFLVRLRNAHGQWEWKGDWSDQDYGTWRQIDSNLRKRLNKWNVDYEQKDEGEFWIDENDLRKNFDITICHFGPGQFIRSRSIDLYQKTWKTTTFSGEWKMNISAGGASLQSRHLNPQYRISLNLNDDSNKDGKIAAVIELIIKPVQNSVSYRPLFAFYIYSLNNLPHKPPMPLDREFFNSYTPLDQNPNFSNSHGRTYTNFSSMFDPGKYCIVPCTKDAQVQASFLLRVFSESRADMWEYDTKISKRLIAEEPKQHDTDEGLNALFYDAAKGEDEVDWSGLRKVLNRSMIPEENSLGIISSFFNFIQYQIKKFLPFHSSDNYESGAPVFTKDECRSMVAMLDDDRSGKISRSEFQNLWNKINFWTKVYDQHKDGTDGYLPVAQLREALGAMGFDINKRIIHSLSYLYADDNGRIPLTDFIICGVALETALSNYNTDFAGEQNPTFSLEEWVKRALIL